MRKWEDDKTDDGEERDDGDDKDGAKDNVVDAIVLLLVIAVVPFRVTPKSETKKVEGV